MSQPKQNKWLTIVKRTLLMNLAATVFVILATIPSGWAVAFSAKTLIVAVVYSFCIGSFCSIAIYSVAPKLSFKNSGIRMLTFSLIVFLAVYLGVILGNFILFVGGMARVEEIIPLSWQILMFPLAVGLIFAGSAYFYEHSQLQLVETEERLRQKEIDEANAKTLATEAQLASLESRIHPHFLFNTLNSIAALIREEPILAEKTVEKLSALLRYSLDSNAKSLVSLRQELEITEKYLEIEKIRFDKRLSYKIECAPQFLETKLPPLSLQTLVENSIKHVVSKTSNITEVTVSVRQNGDSVEIEVCDSGTGFDENKLKENHGLDILRKRLNTIFDNNSNLNLVGNGSVILELPKSIN